MSDILIKGMEIPKIDLEWRIIRGKDGKWYAIDVNAETSDGEWHEIVPVPPHGDLIDKNELKENCMKENGFLAEMLFRKVSNASTIIPAEEGE